MSFFRTSDALRSLDCWLWRIDPDGGRIDTLAGASPMGAGVATWRAGLRLCTADSRRAIVDAARTLLRTERPAPAQRIEGIEVTAAAGHRQRLDMLLGCDPAAQRGAAWIGLVSRPAAPPSRILPAPASPAHADPGPVAADLDAAGLGWWSLADLSHGITLSPTAARLMGFGEAACRVPLGAWLARAAPQDFPRLLRQFESILGGELDRFEIDLFDEGPAAAGATAQPPAQPAVRLPQSPEPPPVPTAGRAGVRLTALRAQRPGRELVGIVQAIAGDRPGRPAATHPGAPEPPQPVEASVRIEAGIDRDSLVREIHHRIKNHLQGMTGLIERYRIDYPGLEGALDAIGGQLQAIGTVYGLLAHSGRSDLSLEEIAQAVSDGLNGIAPGGVTVRFPDAQADSRIAERYCVAIALIINELVMNGIKHGCVRNGAPRVDLVCERAPQACRLSIRNAGALPPAFDFDSGAGARTGLQLVRSMLPARGTALTIRPSAGGVEALLRLEPPVLLVQPAPEMHNVQF